MTNISVVVAGPVPPIPGGISQHTANVVEGLRSAGTTVRTITWAAQYPRRIYPGTLPDSSSEGFSHHAEPILHWARPWTWWRAGRLARDADVLIVPWVTPLQAPAIRTIIGAAGSTRSVALIHNLTPHENRFFDKVLTRWALRHITGVVVHAPSVANEARALLGVDRVEIVPHPPNLSIAARPLPAVSPLRCLFLGIVRPYKGLDVALKALRQAIDAGADIQLTIAGEFWQPVGPYRQLVEELGLSDRVVLQPGYVSDNRLEHLLATHHFVIAPYRSASQSGILPIALAAERPIVTTRIEGLTSVIHDGVNGLIASPNDVGDLARCLIDMQSSLPTLHRGARESGKSSWEVVALAALRAASIS